MKVGLLDTQLCQRRQPPSVTTILTRIMGALLVAFCLLMESACSGNTSSTKSAPMSTKTPILREGGSGTKVAPTPVETTTNQGTTWKLAWQDEFDGRQGSPPDPAKWSPEVSGNGWYHYQLDYDTNNQNVYQDGQGNLVLEARNGNPTGYKCWYGPCKYTSARINTGGHFSFTYGLLEARIKIPSGQGIWPSFWLLGTNCATVGWPNCGEIDLMENVGKEPKTIYGTAHGGPGDFSTPFTLDQGFFSDDFHVFALQWDPNHLYFFVDGINYYTVDRATIPKADWIYDHSFEIILNLAVGGEWPGSPDATTTFPQKMYVSYIRVYAAR